MHARKAIGEEKLMTATLLATGIAHSINNPLGFIRSNLVTLKRYSELLFEGLDRIKRLQDNSDSDIDDIQDIVREISGWVKISKLQLIREDIGPLITDVLEGIDDISFVIQSLLRFNVLNTSWALEMRDINKIVRSVFEQYRPKLHRHVCFTLESDNEPAIAYCNEEQLYVAIENILKNSMEAVGEDGNVFIRVSAGNRQIVIEIKDSGGGICPVYLDKVFEPFFTCKASTGTRHLGLGLTISQLIVHAHSGNIEIRFCESGETAVIISLPSADALIVDG